MPQPIANKAERRPKADAELILVVIHDSSIDWRNASARGMVGWPAC